MRMMALQKEPKLFIAFARPTVGKAISSQRFYQCMVEIIKICSLLAKRPLPRLIKAHSTRTMATSAAFLWVTPLHDVHCAATWASLLIFMKHYTLDKQLHARSRLGRDILSFSA